jgi:integrase
MPRQRTGSIRTRIVIDDKGKPRTVLYARVCYTDKNGKQKSIERKAKSRTDAHALIKAILRELDDGGEKRLDAARMTFTDLASYFETNYLQPPEYVGDRKVSGLRAYKENRRLKEVLVSYFQDARISDITHGDLKTYKARRLKTATIHGGQRSITSVNRELALLRRILNVAQTQGWIIRNPFQMGDSLISTADEVKRERVLSREEEARLLAACTGKRAHLRTILICALDTGMRKRELFTLVWSDVDLIGREISLRAFNTKTAKRRTVPMSNRLARELSYLHTINQPSPADLVFGIIQTVKKGFASACKAAGIADFRFHDARHTCATRLIAGGMQIAEAARILGHTNLTTTYRYVNATPETVTRAADILNRFHEEGDAVIVH